MGKRKLTGQQRADIVLDHAQGMSIRALSHDYKVSRGTIRFIVNPEAAEKNRIQMRLRQRQLREKK